MLVLQTEKLKMQAEARTFYAGPYLHIAGAARILPALGSVLARFMTALHESRRLQAARALSHHHHLIQPDQDERNARFEAAP